MAFIAECFVSGSVPEVAADRQESDQSLSAYLGQHQVVAIVQQAVGACAAAQPAPENPLKFVGEYIQDRHVRGAVRFDSLCCMRCSILSSLTIRLAVCREGRNTKQWTKTKKNKQMRRRSWLQVSQSRSRTSLRRSGCG